MVYRFSWLAGIAAITLAFWELTALLRNSPTGTPWQIGILIATVLGAGITWTAIAYRANAVVVVVVNLVAFVITAGVLVAPDTLWGVFPTGATWDAAWYELQRATEIIRYGVEPVRPLPGIVLMLAALFWTLGFLLVAGLLNRRPFVAVLTPLIVALQFVIIDRRPKSLVHLAVFVTVVALSLLAIRLDERDAGSGRLQRVNGTTRPTNRPSPAVVSMLVITLVLSLTTVAIAGESVPDDGLMTWRQPAGFSDDYSGSVSYNPFTSIKTQVISQTNNPLFRAEIVGADPGLVRFRTVTLDRYENGRWMSDRGHTRLYQVDDPPWIDPAQDYQGETNDVRADIRIENLASPWLPAPATPYAVLAQDDDDQRSLRVRRLDGSIILPGDRTYDGMVYAVRADVPRFDGRAVAALVRAEDGSLSPLFEEALAEGETIPDLDEPREPRELPDAEYWLEYPTEELGEDFDSISADVVGNVSTNFEKALALENWFRASGAFTYDTEVPAGFATSDVVEWLSEPDDENPFRRHGYCEQFATAMALMARSVGVPSRVVLGFTPGTRINDTTVQVMDRNAHSWVEVWIPSYGWMAFDPTPRSRYAAPTMDQTLEEELGFSPAEYIDDIPNPTFDIAGDLLSADLNRLNPDLDRTGFVGSSGGASEPSSPFDLPAWLRTLAVVALVTVLIAGGIPLVKWLRRRRLRARLASGDVTAAWEDIVDRLADLREPVDPSATPREAARAVDDTLVPLADTYDRAVYGVGSTDTIVREATDARIRAEQHLATRYSVLHRLRALYRPSKVIARVERFRRNLNSRK